MIIEVRESAEIQLQKLQLKDSQGIRIVTDEEKSCTMFVDYKLQVDDIMESDQIIMSQEIPFIISNKSIGVLPDRIYISYVEGSGYKLSTDEKILKANIILRQTL